MLRSDGAQELGRILSRLETFGASDARTFAIVDFHVYDDATLLGERNIVLLGEHRILKFGNFAANCGRENQVVAKSILANGHNRPQLMAEIAQKRTDSLPKFGDVHLHGDRDDAVGQLRQLRRFLTI